MLREDGVLVPTTNLDTAQKSLMEDAAARSKDYVRRHWKYREPSPGAADPGNLMERAQSYSLCISGMAFQDAWNIDLERLQRCCIHVITPGKNLIPFCAYYLTDSSGQRLAHQPF